MDSFVTISKSRRVRLAVLLVALLAAWPAYRYAKSFLAWTYDPVRDNATNNVILLTTDWCPSCKQLKILLRDSGIRYVEMDVEKTWAGHWAFRAVKAQGVPVTIVGPRVFYGFNPKLLTELQSVFESVGYKFQTAPSRQESKAPIPAS